MFWKEKIFNYDIPYPKEAEKYDEGVHDRCKYSNKIIFKIRWEGIINGLSIKRIKEKLRLKCDLKYLAGIKNFRYRKIESQFMFFDILTTEIFKEIKNRLGVNIEKWIYIDNDQGIITDCCGIFYSLCKSIDSEIDYPELVKMALTKTRIKERIKK